MAEELTSSQPSVPPQSEPAPVSPPAQATPAEADDPYKDVAPEYRDAVMAAEQSWKNLSPIERAIAMEYAGKEARRVQAEKEKPAQTSDKPVEEVDRVAELEKRVQTLTAERAAERTERENAERAKAFWEVVDDEIGKSEFKDKPTYKKLVRTAMAGMAVTEKVSDIRKATKSAIEELQAERTKEREGYVRGKIEDADATRGEGRGGRPAPNKEERKNDDFMSGRTMERARRHFA